MVFRLSAEQNLSVLCSGSSKSSSTSLLTGVPKATVLGPTRFILYTTVLGFLIGQPDKMQVGGTSVNHHLYADNTQLYISFRPENLSDAQSSLQ